MTRKMKKIAVTMPVFAALLLATACQSGYRNHAKQVTTAYRNGDYQQAAAAAQSGATARKTDVTERVIYHLEAARTAQVAGDYEGSKANYELAYEDIRPYLDSMLGAQAEQQTQRGAIYKAEPQIRERERKEK